MSIKFCSEAYFLRLQILKEFEISDLGPKSLPEDLCPGILRPEKSIDLSRVWSAISRDHRGRLSFFINNCVYSIMKINILTHTTTDCIIPEARLTSLTLQSCNPWPTATLSCFLVTLSTLRCKLAVTWSASLYKKETS